MTLLSLFIIFLAVISGASFYETLAVRVLATLAVVTTLMLWLGSRYAAYALAIFFFAALIGGWLPFDDPDTHTILGSTTRGMLSVMFLFGGYQWWTNAMPFTTAQSEELERERSQVGEWIGILKSSKKTDQVVEFSTKSFFRGYWTYRLLNTGSYWVVARFKSGSMARILDCRVLGIDAVRVKDQPEGKLSVEMGDRGIQEVEISAVMRTRFLRSASANTD